MFKIMYNWKVQNNDMTHLSMVGGKYKIPYYEYNAFFKFYLKNLSQMYMVEKTLYPCKVFMDIDKCKFELSYIIKNVTHDDSFVICQRENNYHLISQNEIVHSPDEMFQYIAKKFYHVVVDTSVYYTGLRMIGSCKNKKEPKVYFPTHLLKNGHVTTLENVKIDKNWLHICSIHTQASKQVFTKHKIKAHTTSIIGSHNQMNLSFIHEEYTQVFVSCINYIKKNDKMYIFTRNKFCTNINRCHKNAYIYFVMDIQTKKIQQRCLCKCEETNCNNNYRTNSWFLVPIKLYYTIKYTK